MGEEEKCGAEPRREVKVAEDSPSMDVASDLAKAKAKSQAGMDKAKQMFEAEKAKKATARERLQKEKETVADGPAMDAASNFAKAKATSQAGIDKAKQMFEAERAKKAAARER